MQIWIKKLLRPALLYIYILCIIYIYILYTFAGRRIHVLNIHQHCRQKRLAIPLQERYFSTKSERIAAHGCRVSGGTQDRFLDVLRSSFRAHTVHFLECIPVSYVCVRVSEYVCVRVSEHVCVRVSEHVCVRVSEYLCIRVAGVRAAFTDSSGKIKGCCAQAVWCT